MENSPKTPVPLTKENFQDKGWAWVVACGAFLIHFLSAGCEKSYSIWYVEILDAFATNSSIAASLGGFCAAVRLILAPISIMLCDRYSIQSIVILGGLLSCAGLLISALTRSILGLYLGFGLVYGSLIYYHHVQSQLGFGLTLVFTPALVVCTVYFEERRATALSLSLSGAGFGAFCVPQLVAYLLRIYAYRGAMFIMAAVVLHYCVSGAIFFTPLGHKRKDQVTEAEFREYVPLAARIKSKLLFIELFNDALFMIFTTSFIFNMMGSVPVTTLIIHYAEEFGMKIYVSIFLFAIEGGVQIVARSLSGLLFDQKIVKKVRGIVWCCDILASATIVCLFALSGNFTVMAILMGFRGLFLAIYISHQTLMTCDMCEKPKESGLLPHAIGLTQFFKGIGVLLGSLISGMLKDITGDYRGAFLFLGFSQMFGSLLALQAIVCRKHNCFREQLSLGTRTGSQEALLSSESEIGGNSCQEEIASEDASGEEHV